MRLQDKNQLDTVSVYDLMGNKFYIPDFQRGYRWSDLEVGKLLTDLEDFFRNHYNANSFYCMQPLVVYFDDKRDAWVVIDGQQRLTTLYLILNMRKQRYQEDYPNMKLFSITYQSRPGSEKYLEDLNPRERDINIDYYHMYNAAETIKQFINSDEKNPRGAVRFVDSILNYNNDALSPSVKFIWYNITNDIKNISPEEKFSDLNVGKIGLTNAELIKALFISNVNSDESEALRISSEWDNIEHALQDNSFWSFIYGKDDGKYSTRIEFLFDLVQKKKLSECNEFYTFDAYSEKIKNMRKNCAIDLFGEKPEHTIVKSLWKEITDKYYLINGWYEDNKLYHIIGYLRYKKYDISKIEDLYKDSAVKNKDAFYKKLTCEALKYFDDVEVRNLNYHDDKKVIYDLLLLFNVLSVVHYDQDNIRFSFARFYSQSWDIEHIRSQTPKDFTGKDRSEWIICNLEYFTGVKYCDDLEIFKNAISNLQIRDRVVAGTYTVGYICDELIKLFDDAEDIDKTDIYDILQNIIFSQNESIQSEEDKIGNLVLLDQGTNRGYKNAFFPVKRIWIYRREHEGIYILPCTKNVFAKNYSSMIYDQMNWNHEDAEAYMDEIERVINNG